MARRPSRVIGVGHGGQSMAEEHLATVDPVLAALIEEHGPCRLSLRRDERPFESIVGAIVAQMVSTQAANTVYARLEAELGGPPTPEGLRGVRALRLRRAGLSQMKAEAILELARRARSGALPLDTLDALDDEAVAAALTAVRGVGPWTVQMVLIFHLGRPDVFPARDLGVLEGMKRAWSLDARPTPKEAELRAAPWAPYRSVAAWYLWRACEGQAAIFPTAP